MVTPSLLSSLKIAALVGVVLAVGVLLWSTPESGTTFASKDKTGRLELTIDSRAYYNGVLQPQLTWEAKNLVPGSDHFFAFSDVKPGDYGSTTISLHLKRGSAWACLDFRHLLDDENTVTEPEVGEDTIAGGDLSRLVQFFAWRDDGDGVYEVGEEALFDHDAEPASNVLRDTTYALADTTHRPAYREKSVSYVGIEWCAGSLAINQATAETTCDGSGFGNETQTDALSVDVAVRAVTARGHERFTCRRPVVVPCQEGATGVQGEHIPTDCDYDGTSSRSIGDDDSSEKESNVEPKQPEWQVVTRPRWHRWLAWVKSDNKP